MGNHSFAKCSFFGLFSQNSLFGESTDFFERNKCDREFVESFLCPKLSTDLILTSELDMTTIFVLPDPKKGHNFFPFI